jgi:opacity protein-like surface antigen
MKQALIASVLIFVFIAPCQASDDDHTTQTISFAAGGTIHHYNLGVPQSVVTASPGQVNVNEGAPFFGGQYLYYPIPHLGVGADGHYSAAGLATPLGTIFNLVTPQVGSKSLVVLGVVKYSFNAQHVVSPYVLGGLGVHHTSRKLAANSVVLGDSSGTGAALGVGGGVDFSLGKNVFVAGEYRYEYLGSADYSTNALGQALGASLKGSTGLVNFFARIGYKF